MSAPAVVVESVKAYELLAFVAGVRVRVKSRKTAPARWLCDEHRHPSGRVSCEHIEALADLTPTPEQLAVIQPHREDTHMSQPTQGEAAFIDWHAHKATAEPDPGESFEAIVDESTADAEQAFIAWHTETHPSTTDKEQ